MQTIDWEDKVATSHLDTVGEVRRLIAEQEYEEAQEALSVLYDAMANSEKRALSSQLTRLMMHVLKWRYQSEKKSTSWFRTIVNARQEIRKLRTYIPSFTREYIEGIWEETFDDAIAEAKAEMNLSRKDKFEPTALTWDEVFEDEYLL